MLPFIVRCDITHYPCWGLIQNSMTINMAPFVFCIIPMYIRGKILILNSHNDALPKSSNHLIKTPVEWMAPHSHHPECLGIYTAWYGCAIYWQVHAVTFTNVRTSCHLVDVQILVWCALQKPPAPLLILLFTPVCFSETLSCSLYIQPCDILWCVLYNDHVLFIPRFLSLEWHIIGFSWTAVHIST